MTKPELNELPMSPFGEKIGIELGGSSNGTASCSLKMEDYHLNTGGRIHGGVLTSLADTTAGMAVRTIRPEGKLSATTDLSISFIRPPKGPTLEAKATVIHAGRQLFRTEITVVSDAKLVARATATFMIVEDTRS